MKSLASPTSEHAWKWTRFWAWLDLMLNALLWGSLTVVGAVVVPMLFALLTPKALAGKVAAELFVLESILVLLVSLYGLIRQAFTSRTDPIKSGRRRFWVMWAVALNLLLSIFMLTVVIGQIIQPDNPDRALWHGLGSAVYALMWFLAAKELSQWAGSRRP